MTLFRWLDIRHWLGDPHRRRTLGRIGLAVLVAAYIGTFVKGIRGTLHKNDGYDYYVAARAVVDGRDPAEAMLDEIGYMTYPPSHALLFAPLTVLGHGPYAVVWNGLNLALVVLTPALALGVVTGRVRGHPVWWYALPAVVAFRLVETNAGLSQSNLLIGFICLLAMYCLRRGWAVRAGMAVALGAAIKITPGLYGVYFLWRKRWAAAASALGTAIVLFLLLPVLVYGSTGTIEQYRVWRTYASDLTFPDNKQFDYMHGQSVQAALLRLLTKSNARKPSKGEYYVNLVDWDRDHVRKAVLPISIAIVIGVLAVSRNPVRPREALGPYLEMALLLVAILVISPYVRKAHYAMLYPALCIAIAALLAGRVTGPPGRRLAWSIGVLAVVVNFTAPAIVTKAGSDFFNAICLFLWATLPFGLALAGAVLACRRRSASTLVPHAVGIEGGRLLDAGSADT